MAPVKLQTEVNVQADTVDAALAAEDFAPLVRLVFDAFAASLNASTTKDSLLSRPVSLAKMELHGEDSSTGESAAASKRASDKAKALRKQAAQPMLQALEDVLDAKSTELSQICRGNAEEIASSLQDLGSMQNVSQELQKRIAEGDAALRHAGSSFVAGLEQLQELNRVANAVTVSCQAVGAARQLLALCTQAGRAVNGNELYKAYCFLKRAQAEFLGGTLDPGGLLVLEEDSSKLSRTVGLHGFLTSKVREMETTMQEKAISDFNNWLVSVRREAKAIGTLSLARAAWQRNRDESLSMQRRRLASELSSVIDLEEFAAELAKPLPKMSQGTAKLDPRVHPAAVAVLGIPNVDPSADMLAKIDMTPLHRCLQVHSCLGRMDTFKAYYQINRRTQLNNDLAANVNFAQQYEAYIAQVVGYFVIEDRVARATDAMAGQIDAGWETAVAFLKPALETVFLHSMDPINTLAIKDYMLLACSALLACGYHAAPLLDVLLNGKTPYFELKSKAMDKKMRELMDTHGTAACAVLEASQAAELSGTLGLPLIGPGRAKGDLGPTPPFTAAFSQMLPEALWQARRYVEETAAYAWGLMSQAEMLSLVRLQRDMMLTNSYLDAINQFLSKLQPTEPDALFHALQIIADLNFFSEALQALDDYTYLTVRGVHPVKDTRSQAQNGNSINTSMRGSLLAPSMQGSLLPPTMSNNSHGGASVMAYTVRAHQTCQPANPESCAGLLDGIRELCAAAQLKAQAALAVKVHAAIQQHAYKDWEPEEPLRHAGDQSELLKALIEVLNDSLVQLKKYLWEEAYFSNARGLVKQMGEGLLGLLLSDKLESFNIYAVFALTDDALALSEASVATKIPAIEDGLAELLQVCDVLAMNKIDDILNESKRQQSYPAINLKNFQIILRKFKEVKQKSGHSPLPNRSKQPESFLKRKAVEKVAKLLRL